MRITNNDKYMLVYKLQNQSQIPQWALANEEVISFLSGKTSSIKSRRYQLAYRLIKLASSIGFEKFIIISIGALNITKLWYRALRLDDKTERKPMTLFASFGASSDHELYNHYANQKEDLLFFNWLTLENIGYIGKPALIKSLKAVFKHAKDISKKIKRATLAPKNLDNYFLAICALNIGEYVYFRELWQGASSRQISEVIFTSASLIAFSAIDEGIYSTYHVHGLLSSNILFPGFDNILTITREECLYLQSCGLLAQCNTQKPEKAPSKTDTIMLLSINVDFANRKHQVTDIIDFFRQHGFTIIIRPTISASEDDMLTITKHFPYAIIDNTKLSFSDSLYKWKPSFIIAWTSTCMHQALQSNILSISLNTADKNWAWNMLYPLKEKVLHWPRDQKQISNAIQSKENYEEILDLFQR